MISPVRVSDYRLLHRFAFEEDHAAFEELVRRHAGMARGVCRRVLGPSGDADDAAQTAFLSLAKHAKPLALRLGPTGSLAGWLYRVAVNAALQQRRASKARRRREAAVVRERESWSDGVAGGVEHSELLALLDEELKELPPRYRTPLVLCHLEGKTQHEAADALGLSYGTLRRRLDRGRKLLRSRIGRRGVVASGAVLAVFWRSAEAQAGVCATALVGSVAAAIKGAAPSVVTVLKPRVATSARVPRSGGGVAGPVSATVYSLALAAVLTAMAIPPMVSLIAATGDWGPSQRIEGPSMSPGGSLGRSAV